MKCAETCLELIIDFLSCILRSFDTVTSIRKGFCSERAAAGLGPSGLMSCQQQRITSEQHANNESTQNYVHHKKTLKM